MSLPTGLGLLLALAAALVIGLEVTRELGNDRRRTVALWRPFMGGALMATIVLAMVATIALLRTAA